MRIRMKLAVIAALMLALTVPLLLVVSKIYERDNYQEQARRDIAQSWTGEQLILGPILIVPYTRTFWKQEFNKELRKYFDKKVVIKERLFVLPDSLTGQIKLDTDIRYRGIYKVPVYSGVVSLSGEFSNADFIHLERPGEVIEIGQPYLSIVVNDMRGIVTSPTLSWAAEKVDFVPGSGVPFERNGIHAPLPNIELVSPKRYRFSADLAIRGMSAFHIVPVGKSSSVSIVSSWPHPKFEGLYLPMRREITDAGFTANWQTSSFSTNIAEQAKSCAAGNCAAFVSNKLSVTLIDPVDIYLQAQRASKYGILFIGLTFAAFFLFEVIKQLAVHPIQYGLVGMALSIFYLLLVSFAEHIAFLWSYCIATAACSGLLGFYISYVLKSYKRGLAFAFAIANLYAILYVIIQAEDYAFSMGAGLTFVALAAVMYVTRNIDWYEIGGNSIKKPEDWTEG